MSTTQRQSRTSQSRQVITSTNESRSSSRASDGATSPTRITRVQEKLDLQNLNDRLASYIDRVRQLEAENNRLTRTVRTSEEMVQQESTRLRNTYENELKDTRALADELSREKAKLEIDTKRLFEDLDDARAKLDKKTKDLQFALNENKVKDSKINDLQKNYTQAIGERKKLQDDNKELEKEVNKLQKALDETRKALENEIMARVDLHNQLQTVKDSAAFRVDVLQKELSEVRVRRQTEITEIDGRLAQQYEHKLQEALQDLRDQYEDQMAVNRQEIEALYENKTRHLQEAADRNSKAAQDAVEELRKARSRNDATLADFNRLQRENNKLKNDINDLNSQMDDLRCVQHEMRTLNEAELTRLRAEATKHIQEYQDLMDIKCSLDVEISAYRKLLEGEETRLNLSVPSSTSNGSRSEDFDASSGSSKPLTRSQGNVQSRKRVIHEERTSSVKTFRSG